MTRLQEKTMVYWSHVVVGGWALHVAATQRGLCYVSLPGEPYEVLAQWVSKRIKGGVLMRDDEAMLPYLAELREYLQGERKQFGSVVDLYGTPFQCAVWQALGDIGFGDKSTYSEIASRIGRPSAVRAVGAAIGGKRVGENKLKSRRRDQDGGKNGSGNIIGGSKAEG
ncbi:MAG: cysteine methyltransferase [Paenibacillaceae bacterium]|nr:cysteine methyltransferase [Paenibacillaceae bacterium]